MKKKESERKFIFSESSPHVFFINFTELPDQLHY